MGFIDGGGQLGVKVDEIRLVVGGQLDRFVQKVVLEELGAVRVIELGRARHHRPILTSDRREKKKKKERKKEKGVQFIGRRVRHGLTRPPC